MGMSDLIFRDVKTLEIEIDKIVDAVLAAMPESNFKLSEEKKRIITGLLE